MRIISLLTVFFLACIPTRAQQYQIEGEWEFSATLSPRFFPRIALESRFVRIPDDQVPSDVRNLEAVEVDGEQRFYAPEEIGKHKYVPTNVDFWHAAHFRFERRLASGLGLTLGTFYSRARYAQQALRPQQLPSDILYNVNQRKDLSIGLTAQAFYHFRGEHRFQPYVGAGFLLARETTASSYLGRAIDDAGSILLVPTDRRTLGTTSDGKFKYLLTAGLTYRLLKYWSIGLEINSRMHLGQGLVGLQIRKILPITSSFD